MTKRTLVLLLFLGLVLLALVGALLFRRQKLFTSVPSYPAPIQNQPQIQPIETHQTDPATMAIAADQCFVEWQVVGQLTAPLKTEGELLVGTLTLEGDRQAYPLPVWIGLQQTPQLLGLS